MERPCLMTKIIRERYEAGLLVTREIEGSGAGFIEIARLCVHLVIAVSIAVIAALYVLDTYSNNGTYEQTEISDTRCTAAIRS
jgi:hypothetical protein